MRYPWVESIEEGDFVVIDQSGLSVGLMGSENTLNCLRRGVCGFVTNGGVRDTDEIIQQKIPFWSPLVAQCMVQGRLQYDAHDVPVAVGGSLSHPGDVIVATVTGSSWFRSRWLPRSPFMPEPSMPGTKGPAVGTTGLGLGAG